MGKDYSKNDYKKSYDSEYTQSYETTNQQKKLDGQIRRDFDTISKGLNDKPYPKTEKGAYDGLQPTTHNQVSPEGRYKSERRRLKEHLAPKVSEPEVIVKPKPAATPPPAPLQPKVQTPPLFVPRSTPPPQLQHAPNTTSFGIHPIRLVSQGKYQINQTGQIIGVDAARALLTDCGYAPQKSSAFSIGVLIASIFTFVYTPLFPILLFIVGAWSAIKVHTIYRKRVGSSFISMQLPSHQDQINANRKRGYVYMGVAAVMFIVYLTQANPMV